MIYRPFDGLFGGIYDQRGSPAITVTGGFVAETTVGTPSQATITITNTGQGILTLSPPVTATGQFTIFSQPALTLLVPNQFTTFVVECTAVDAGTINGTVSIANNTLDTPKVYDVSVVVSALLYGDEFTGTVSAPIPAALADVRGYYVVNDIENLMTIGSGVLNVPAQASAVWGDEYYRAQPSSGQQYWTRPSGHALVAVTNFRNSTRNQQMPVGWWSSATLDSSVANKSSIFAISPNIRTYLGDTVSDSQPFLADTDYPAISVWDSTGFHTYVKINGVWHKKWFNPSVVTQAYAGMSSFNAVASLKYFRIYAIDESLFAPALSIVAPTVGNLADLPDGDVLVYLDNITLPSSGTIDLRARKLDDSNYWNNRNDLVGTFSVREVVAGASTTRISSGTVVNTDDQTIIYRAQNVQAWRNTTALGSAYTSAYNFLRNKLFQLNSLGTGGAIAAIYAWKARLLTEGALGAELVTNGSFTGSASGWTLGTGWAYSSNSVSKVADVASRLEQASIVTTGKYYEITFTVSNYVAGTLSISWAGLSEFFAANANGTYTLRGVAGFTSVGLLADSAFAGTIDNVSVKEITFSADALALVLDGLAA